jgi:hypothetical protein
MPSDYKIMRTGFVKDRGGGWDIGLCRCRRPRMAQAVCREAGIAGIGATCKTPAQTHRRAGVGLEREGNTILQGQRRTALCTFPQQVSSGLCPQIQKPRKTQGAFPGGAGTALVVGATTLEPTPKPPLYLSTESVVSNNHGKRQESYRPFALACAVLSGQ